MDLEKFNTINNKMNKITKELTKNVEIGEDILTSTDQLAEVIKSVKPKPQDLTTMPIRSTKDISTNLNVEEMAQNVVNVDTMVEDFSYMRSMLRETTQNAKRVLESVTEELMLGEEDSRASLIVAFSELNKAQLEGIKLFMMSYKEISIILANFAKVQQSNKRNETNNIYTTNVLNMETPISSADIINRLRD